LKELKEAIDVITSQTQASEQKYDPESSPERKLSDEQVLGNFLSDRKLMFVDMSKMNHQYRNGGDGAAAMGKKKLKKIKQLLVKRNRDIALIERKIDDIPERSELTQYQRQFVELYEQVASKFTETRQYFTFYNTLEDTKAYLSKEVAILNSINDSYKGSMGSKSTREPFIESLNNILKTITQSLEKVEQKLNTEKESKVTLTEKYNTVVDKERLYFKATKEFLEECKKNELLQSKLS